MKRPFVAGFAGGVVATFLVVTFASFTWQEPRVVSRVVADTTVRVLMIDPDGTKRALNFPDRTILCTLLRP